MLNGLVLAGGQSRRMGQDKALLKYKGQTLLEHACELLTVAGCSDVLISRNGPGFVCDIIADAGPLAGVHAALSKLDNHSELLVFPVDMPHMAPNLLNKLCRMGRSAGKACYVQGRMLPFYLPVNEHIKNRLTQYLTVEQERKVVRFLNAIDALAITDDEEALWLNVNTPSDWPDEK